MRNLAGGVAVTLTAVMLMASAAKAGVVQVVLVNGGIIAAPETVNYYDRGNEANNLVVNKRNGAITFTERGGALVLPEIINGLDVLNPVRFLQVCTLGLTTSTCKVLPGTQAYIWVDVGNGNDRVDASSSTQPGELDLNGGAGNDTIVGSPNADTIVAGPGNDIVDGGAGDDWLDVTRPSQTAPNGSDVFRGGAGNDLISASDGNADQIFCGDGNDAVDVDALDVAAADCETVF
jgi:Ca2+-binding RTX toxin-like protein